MRLRPEFQLNQLGIGSGRPGASAGIDQISIAIVKVTHLDAAKEVLIPKSKLVPQTEAGGTATFSIKLLSQPTAHVTIGLSSSNIAEGTALPASVTFTPTNRNVVQTITVTGVNDAPTAVNDVVS